MTYENRPHPQGVTQSLRPFSILQLSLAEVLMGNLKIERWTRYGDRNFSQLPMAFFPREIAYTYKWTEETCARQSTGSQRVGHD